MLIELLSLEKMPVGALEEAEMIGRVCRLIFDPVEVKLIGFLVKEGGYFSKTHAVSMSDVVDIDKNGVVISSRESLVEKDEIVRLAEIVNKKFSLIGLPVRTKSGKKLGRVENALVDGTSGDLLRIYLGSTFSRRVFERSQIEKVTLLEVVVKKDLQKSSPENGTNLVSAVETEVA